MRGVLPKYFSSEWSFAQFRVPEQRSIVAFGAEYVVQLHFTPCDNVVSWSAA
jgi:hypothetical protein